MCEDNEATIKLILNARSMALRHLKRTHRFKLDWLFEVMSSQNIFMRYVSTKVQLADMMTRAFTRKEVWNVLVYLSALMRPASEITVTERRNTASSKRTVPNAVLCCMARIH